MGLPWDWKINEIERNATAGAEAAKRLHELDALRSDVDCLERANQRLCSYIDELRATVEAYLDRIQKLEAAQETGK